MAYFQELLHQKKSKTICSEQRLLEGSRQKSLWMIEKTQNIFLAETSKEALCKVQRSNHSIDRSPFARPLAETDLRLLQHPRWSSF